MNELLPGVPRLCVALALLATITVPLASAADDKTYSAAMCDLYAGTQKIRPDHGTLLNYYFDSVTADCPIVRDNIHNTGGTKAVWVRARDEQAELGDIVCLLFTSSLYGHDFEWHQVEQRGWWEGSLYLDVDVSYPLGYYHLWCSFPFESRFYGYRVSEHD